MSPKKSVAEARKAKVAAMQAKQRRAQRRRDLFMIGSVIVVLVALIGTVSVVIVREQRRQGAVAAAADRPIEGVREFDDLSQNHVGGPVSYPQTPAVGGDHAQVWQNCGVYSEPLVTEQAVHSLEHGAVWIGYQPDLPADQVEALAQVGRANSYVLVSPVEGIGAPVTLSAWGRQLELESASDPRLEVFVRAFQQGPTTPEPGAACTGGIGEPL